MLFFEKEKEMKQLMAFGLAVCISTIFGVSQGWAENETLTYPECEKISDGDRKNICRATSNPTHGKKDVNRFTNKDHSWYYCSLVKGRDLQNLCIALVDSDKAKCDLIGNQDIAKECLSKLK